MACCPVHRVTSGPGEGQCAKEQESERDHVKVAAHQGL